LPLNNKVPPELAEYQSIVSPVAGVAEIVTVPVPHLEPAIPVGAVGDGFTTTIALPVIVLVQVVVVLVATTV
jgi:hypothetical protein